MYLWACLLLLAGPTFQLPAPSRSDTRLPRSGKFTNQNPLWTPQMSLQTLANLPVFRPFKIKDQAPIRLPCRCSHGTPRLFFWVCLTFQRTIGTPQNLTLEPPRNIENWIKGLPQHSNMTFGPHLRVQQLLPCIAWPRNWY